jgi:hypothetical protein
MPVSLLPSALNPLQLMLPLALEGQRNVLEVKEQRRPFESVVVVEFQERSLIHNHFLLESPCIIDTVYYLRRYLNKAS